MNALDWVILLIMMFSALLAAAQGFFFEVISLAGAILGYLLAAWGYGRLAPWFLQYVKSPAFADLAGFLTIFLSVVILAGAIARLARWFIREAGLRWIDRALGAAFGFLRGFIVVTAGLLAVTAFAPDSTELTGSQLAPYFRIAGSGASWLAPSEIRQKFREGIAKLRGTPVSGAAKAYAGNEVNRRMKSGLSAQPEGEEHVKDQLEALVAQMHGSGILYSEAVREFKKRFIMNVLQQNKGNQCKAARELGMHRNTLSRTVAELDLDVKEFRDVGRRPVRSEKGLAMEKKAVR